MNMKVKFLGAAQNVTGSRYLLKVNGMRLLVDCGLYQEHDLLGRNWDPFPVPPDSIDAVLLSHAHLDHSGWLPKLVKDGFHGKIYCTQATAEIGQVILLDAAHLQEEDAEFKKRRHEREGRVGPHGDLPLYTTDDARAVFPLFSTMTYEHSLDIGNGIEVTLHDAGHVLGSAVIRVKATKDGQQESILFSGDLGTGHRPLLNDPVPLAPADYVVVESTYGDRLHEDVKDVEDMLADVINSTRRAGGNIVIPSFALERAQRVLYHLNDLLLKDRIPHLMVFVDSPMAVNITEIYEHHPELLNGEAKLLIRQHHSPFDFSGLKMVDSVDESKAINHITGTVVIIAGAGMCNGGRIKHHLVNNIGRPESTILFVGYQAVGTLGRQIVDGAKRVRIYGEMHQVRARIVQIHGFSGHADRDGLFHWLRGIQGTPKRLFVTHGEPEAARSFADFVREKTSWDVSVPAYGDEFMLT